MNIMETKNQLILAYETVLQPNSSIQARKDAENVIYIIISVFLSLSPYL